MTKLLRVVIAAVEPPRAAALALDARELGHEVSGADPPVAELRDHIPDVILVGRAAGDEHCLSLVALAARELECTSVVVLHTLDQSFAVAAAERGAHGCLVDSGPAGLATTLAVAHLRRLDHTRLLQEFGRRAVVEQAKGILMTRNSISSDRAFVLLRRHSQRTNRKIVEIAQSVINSHALLLPSALAEAPSESMLAALSPQHQRQATQQSHVSSRP
jgi:AmiR/NasT family two-component response regulator